MMNNSWYYKNHQYRIENRLCIYCGQKLNDNEHFKSCQNCRNKHSSNQQEQESLKQYRQLLKSQHLCRECKKQDAYTLAGRTCCFECATKMAKRKRETSDYKQQYTKLKIKKQQREQNNLCIYCGRPLSVSNPYKSCEYCRQKRRKHNNNKTPFEYKNRGNNGLCWQCNKNPPVEGKKLCQSCYDKKLPIALQNLERSREINRDRMDRLYEYHKITSKIKAESTRFC